MDKWIFMAGTTSAQLGLIILHDFHERWPLASCALYSTSILILILIANLLFAPFSRFNYTSGLITPEGGRTLFSFRALWLMQLLLTMTNVTEAGEHPGWASIPLYITVPHALMPEMLQIHSMFEISAFWMDSRFTWVFKQVKLIWRDSFEGLISACCEVCGVSP